MPMLVGIEGVKGGKVPAAGVTSRTAAIRSLRDGEPAITAASDEGAVTVWKLDAGGFRCEFHRYKAVVDSKDYQYLAAVDQWLRAWWPRMSRR